MDAHYTAPKYLAANGASAGGITMGGALTWRPDLFGVILDQVGLSDALRFETQPNGPPNVVEFGSVKTEAGFHGLYAMSAYAQVHDGTAYPAAMFLTGANDPRVSPSQMLKMAARVQAATASGRPVLLRVDYDAGHGIGSTTSRARSHFRGHVVVFGALADGRSALSARESRQATGQARGRYTAALGRDDEPQALALSDAGRRA